MNTLEILLSKHEARTMNHDSMNQPKIEFIAYI